MKSNKIDYNHFPIILSIIGLIADCLTIAVFYKDINSTNKLNGINDLSIILMLFIMTYSWFSISWIISKKSLQKLEEAKNHLIITKTTIGLGVLLLPISIGISFVKLNGLYILFHVLIWIIVYGSIRFLMSVIHPEYNTFMKSTSLIQDIIGLDSMNYKGKWQCIHEYTSLSSREKFSKNDFIVVFEQQYNGGYTDYFYYNSSNNNRGLIHYSELDTYWKRRN